MSSHHFVREGQEPALMIIDAIDYERIAPLLEWAPIVLVHENSIEDVLSWGIKIDGVICNSARVGKLKDTLAGQMPLEMIEFSADRDGTNSAIEFLVDEKQEAVCIVVQDVKKIMSITTSLPSKINITLLTQDLRWSLIRNGRFEKWMTKGQQFFFRFDSDFHEKEGVIEQDDKLITERDGIIKLKNDQAFWLGEEY
jgi:hypothetical protein